MDSIIFVWEWGGNNDVREDPGSGKAKCQQRQQDQDGAERHDGKRYFRDEYI